MLKKMYSQDQYRLHLNACPVESKFILFLKKTLEPDQLASSEVS